MPDVPTIEGYTDLVPIGRGGLGDVYRAEQLATGAEVAIKVLRDVSDSSVAWHRTRRELNALLALSGHANVVQIVELLDRPHGPALVMEYAPGGSVADLLHDRDGTLSVDETVFVGRQTAAALVSAHARGIVHRDIKPQNLLIDADGQVQLCDFGIAALTRDEEYGGRTNAISMRYASPEDLEHHDPEAGDAADGSAERGADAVGPASDVYSLGATLLHLARGAPPTLKQRLAPWTPSATADAHLAALDRVIARCLHPTPTMRPTAQGLLDALDGLALGAGSDRVIALPVIDRTAAPTDAPAAPTVLPEDRRMLRPRSVDASDVDPEADTLTRPSRPGDDVIDRAAPRELPRPVPTGARWHRPVLLAIAALIVAAATVLLWPSDDADAPGPQTVPPPNAAISTAPATTHTTTQTTTPANLVAVARPADLVALTDDEVVWNVGAVSDCLVQVADRDELAVVACSEDHDLQRFAAGSVVDLGIDALFDQEAVARAVTAACTEAFSVFVASPLEGSALRIAQTRPNADTWAAGDRDYHCYLGIEGARIIGDARSTGW